MIEQKTVSMKAYWRKMIATEFFRKLDDKLHTDYKSGLMRRSDKGKINRKTRWYISELELRKLKKSFRVDENDFKLHNLS